MRLASVSKSYGRYRAVTSPYSPGKPAGMRIELLAARGVRFISREPESV